MQILTGPLHLNPSDFRFLLKNLGPSLGLWRAAEIAALREQAFPRPVLDLGCGDGTLTSMVLPVVDIGLDPDPGVIQQAGRLGIYQNFEIAPAESTRLPSASVATVLSNSVLEHLPDVDGALNSAARLLQPGGRMIITTPGEAFSCWLALPSRRYARWRNQQLIHRNIWSLERWTEHLQRAGLEVETARPYLRHRLVTTWDALDLLQMIWIARRRVAGLLWRSLPDATLSRIAQRAAALDLSSPLPGGGCLIVARK